MKEPGRVEGHVTDSNKKNVLQHEHRNDDEHKEVPYFLFHVVEEFFSFWVMQ